MGSVYKAENTAIGRTVAIKLLHGHLADDGVTLARFQREARAAASVGHPHVVEILDMGVEPTGAPFIVMEYVRGMALSRVLHDEGELEPARAADIAGQILDALGALHDRGVVHRDLKPENVLLTVRNGRSDFVKLFDFGVATYVDGVTDARRGRDLTPSGRTMGTPYYSSPEQIAGSGGRDARVDIYAVGVLTYEMVTGRRPFSAPGFPELCRSILEDEPAPMRAFVRDVPQGLEAVVLSALSKDPDARFATAREMLGALAPFGAQLPEEEPEPTDTFTQDLRALRAREAELLAGEQPDGGAVGGEAVLGIVRGEVPLAMIAFLEARLGASVLAGVLEAAGPGAAAMLRQGVSPDGWYPELVLDVLEKADELVGEGDRKLIADAGRHFARTVFGASRELLSGSLTPELLLSMSSDLWRRYFAQGEVRVVKVGMGYGRVEVHGQPKPRLGRAVAVVGYLDEALRMAGARDVDVRLVRAASLGDPHDVLEATWSS
jgi:serine/threonine-protein kinase